MSQQDVDSQEFEVQQLGGQMDLLRDRDVQIGAAIGLIVGLLLGWFALGWWLAPVQWVNAEPSDLHPDWQAHYVAMVADSYLLTGDTQTARARLQGFDADTLGRVFGEVETKFENRGAARQARAVQQLADQLDVTIVPPATAEIAAGATTAATQVTAPTTAPAAGATTGEGGGRTSLLVQVCGWALVIMLIIVAGVGSFIWYQRRADTQFGEADGEGVPAGRRLDQDFAIQSMNLGERKRIQYQNEGPGYEQTVQIYRGGEIVGECGLKGIPTLSESGHVVACAAWLYEPQTPERSPDTRALVSRRVYANHALRGSLMDDREPGEVIPAEPGYTTHLEHQTLEMTLRVVDVEYADLEEQYLSRLEVELEPIRKRRDSEDSAASSAPIDFD